MLRLHNRKALQFFCYAERLEKYLFQIEVRIFVFCFTMAVKLPMSWSSANKTLLFQIVSLRFFLSLQAHGHDTILVLALQLHQFARFVWFIFVSYEFIHDLQQRRRRHHHKIDECVRRDVHMRVKKEANIHHGISCLLHVFILPVFMFYQSLNWLTGWLAGLTWLDSTAVLRVCVSVRVIENQIKSVHWFCNWFLVLRDSYHLRSYLSVDPFISMCHSAQVNKPCGCVRYISVNTLIRLIQLNWSANIQPSSWDLKSGSSFKKCKHSVFRRNAYHCGVIYKSYMHSSFR